MSKSAKSIERRKVASTGQLWLRLPGLVREALYETVIGAGLACVDEVLETERVALCGERYAHLVDREASRAGQVANSLVLGGRRVAVKRSSAQRGRSRNQVTELARMEFARSAAAARRRTDGVGSIDPALRALAGTVARSDRSAGHQQERGERALRLRHRAQVGGADEPGSARAPIGSLANRWRALR